MSFRRALPGLLVLVAVACSSGGDSGVTPTNDPPTVAFTFAKLAVPRGEPADLTVSADDPDGDKLTINWSITRGTLTAQNASRTIMRWATPSSEGADTVTIRVTDGTFNRTVTAVVKVGRPTTGQTALALYEKTKSPYIISLPDADPTLTIGSSTTTVIEPGVELLFETEGSILRVVGRLEALGTADLPIVFRPNDRTFRCGDERGWWEGIWAATEFGSDGDIDFEHVEVWYAQTGLRLNDNASAVVSDCSFRCSGDAGLLMGGSGTLVALDSKINNGRVDGVSVSAVVSVPDSVLVQGCAIELNGGAGLRLNLADFSQSAPVVIEYNTIHFNEEHGISLANAVFPRIHNNSFTGNGESTVSNIYLQNGYPGGVAFPELDATCNFWGAATSSQGPIDQTIHDSLDSGQVATRVKSCPWLNESPITAPPDCSMVCP
jgi:parallel beta-helix repeat protein